MSTKCSACSCWTGTVRWSFWLAKHTCRLGRMLAKLSKTLPALSISSSSSSPPRPTLAANSGSPESSGARFIMIDNGRYSFSVGSSISRMDLKWMFLPRKAESIKLLSLKWSTKANIMALSLRNWSKAYISRSPGLSWMGTLGHGRCLHRTSSIIWVIKHCYFCKESIFEFIITFWSQLRSLFPVGTGSDCTEYAFDVVPKAAIINDKRRQLFIGVVNRLTVLMQVSPRLKTLKPLYLYLHTQLLTPGLQTSLVK